MQAQKQSVQAGIRRRVRTVAGEVVEIELVQCDGRTLDGSPCQVRDYPDEHGAVRCWVHRQIANRDHY